MYYRDCFKNQCCRSEVGEESLVFSNQKIKKYVPWAYSLKITKKVK
ncbi:hypothetical protein SULYE_0247 [Sulfurihydrogenibium yellowstonense SS-5]|uniref:Uncharacterized protein n=1 Tax=Sulfurihydrogenibium yellowstonense SS-5 TaxID=432331 RepID=C4FI63_9AQUI|nr:hypothetical protein SULYE_0247 [Sulfurihydrogenibium yellowstonense SS-5]